MDPSGLYHHTNQHQHQQPIYVSPSTMDNINGPRIEIFFITCCIGGIFFATTISLIVIICCCKFSKLNDEVILNKLSSVNVHDTMGQTTATSTSDSMQTQQQQQQQYHQSIRTPISNPLKSGIMTNQTAHNLMQQLQTLQFLLQQQIAKENTTINNSIGFNSIDNLYPYHHSHHSINNSIDHKLVRSASVQPQIDILPQRQRQRRLSVDNSPFNTNVPIQHHLNLQNRINNNDNKSPQRLDTNKNAEIENQFQFLEYLELQRRKSSQNSHHQKQKESNNLRDDLKTEIEEDTSYRNQLLQLSGSSENMFVPIQVNEENHNKSHGKGRRRRSHSYHQRKRHNINKSLTNDQNKFGEDSEGIMEKELPPSNSPSI